MEHKDRWGWKILTWITKWWTWKFWLQKHTLGIAKHQFVLKVIPYHSNYFLHPYLDIGLTGVCRWDVIGIVPIAMRSLLLRGIVGIDVLRLNVIGILGPGRKKLLLYNSDEASLAVRSSLFSLHFPSAKTLWVLTSPSLLLSVVVYVLLGGLLWVTRLWLCRRWTSLVLASLARQ